MEKQMTQQEYERRQEMTFDSFCMKVIQNEATSIIRELSIREKHETPLEELTAEELNELQAEDQYNPYKATFHVRGESVIVHDPELAEALRYISAKMRDVILLFYFLDRTETQIGQLMGITQSTVNRRRISTLHQLQKLIEAMTNDQ